MTYPLWATPERRACLLEMAVRELPHLSEAFMGAIDLVIFGMTTEGEIVKDLVNVVCYDQKEYWKADDRDKRSYLWKLEKRRMHLLRPHLNKRGEWDSIRREEYLANRETFEITAIGISAFTFKRIAGVRIPSLKANLWVDLTGIEVNNGKSRKLARYKRGVAPKQMESRIIERCRKAVERYLERPQS